MALAPIVEAFTWGKGGAKMSPEEIAREREIAQALMQVDTSPVGHWSQGLARVANAAAGAFKDYRAGQAEKGNAAFNSDIVASLLGGSGGAASIAPSLPSAMSGNAGTAAGGSALASLPTGERADYIRSGLLKRGLPEHVADAFILNFQDESGLDPGINEANPIVPGSRGGFGLYQLTGPRRRAYEAFAQQRGAPLDDIDAQLDFLMLEGQGDERKAFESILSAPDTGTAAAAIVNNFLRPAEAHRTSRANRYLSYQGQPSGGAVDAVNAFADGGVPVAETDADIMAQEAAMSQQDPSAFAVNPVAEALTTGAIPAPDANPNAAVASSLTRHAVNPDLPMAGGTSGFAPVAQALTAQAPQQAQGGGMQQAIIQALSDPRASDQTRNIASILLQQQMQSQDPMRQLEMDYKRAQLDQLRNPQPDLTSGQREYNMAVQQGYQGSFMDYKRDLAEAQRAQTNITVGGDGAPGLGKLSADYGYVLDPQTRQPVIDPATGLPQAAPVPGSPAAIAAEQAAAEQERLAGAQTLSDADKAETTLDATGSVLDIMRDAETPATGTLSRPFSLYSGTPAGKVRSYVKTLQSGVALGAMQRLKEMSATGATGFGSLSAPELDLLINDIGALDPDNTEPEIFTKTVERIRDRSRRVAQDIAKNVSPERIQELGLQPFIDAFKAGEASGSVNKPISEMTDEELEALANGN